MKWSRIETMETGKSNAVNNCEVKIAQRDGVKFAIGSESFWFQNNLSHYSRSVA